MKPPPFDYVAAATLDEALHALAEGGEDAKVLAGGQSLIPLMSLRLARPSLLVDVTRAEELGAVERGAEAFRIGATVCHRRVERSAEVRNCVPLIADAMPLVGHVAIRTRGTIGGSLAHADPAAELPAVALALGATFTVRSRDRGERAIAADDFFQGYFTTALEPDEILTAISFPIAGPNNGFAIEEVARRHGDFAMVGAAIALTVTDGTIVDARVAMINAAERPVRATAAEEALRGASVNSDGGGFADAAAAAVGELEPSGDLHASPAYRRKVAAVCVRRGLERAAAQAKNQESERA
ncbi:MAG TPA: xanthine dehydrogenase family protein subunit M [Acidimicrobiales bacterium]|nr:xanthine dehydrogenase family protein subunit M [Acidimicrobiales bacterium]